MLFYKHAIGENFGLSSTSGVSSTGCGKPLVVSCDGIANCTTWGYWYMLDTGTPNRPFTCIGLSTRDLTTTVEGSLTATSGVTVPAGRIVVPYGQARCWASALAPTSTKLRVTWIATKSPLYNEQSPTTCNLPLYNTVHCVVHFKTLAASGIVQHWR